MRSTVEPRSVAVDLGCGPGPWALAAAAGLDVNALSDAALLDAVAEVERSLAWAAAVRARLIAAYAMRSVLDPSDAEQDAARDWHRERLAAATQTSPHEAHVRCETALALESRLPATAAMLRSGSLPWAQAVVLARESAGLDPAWSAQVERTVLADPRAVSVRQVARATRRAVTALRPADADSRAAAAAEARSLRIRPTQDGLAVVQAVLPTDQAAVVAAALEPLASRESAADERTAEQRRADALVRLATGDHPPHVAVQLLVRDGAGELDRQPLAPGTTARLTCTADTVHPYRVDRTGALHPAHPSDPSRPADRPASAGPPDRPGHPQPADGSNLAGDGNTRAPGAAMRRRLDARDGGCRFPGCPTSPRRCHAHHLRHWADGGPTTDDNLILLCSRHHHATHEDGWQLTGPPTNLVWTDPHGHRYTQPAPTTTVPAWTSDPPLWEPDDGNPSEDHAQMRAGATPAPF